MRQFVFFKRYHFNKSEYFLIILHDRLQNALQIFPTWPANQDRQYGGRFLQIFTRSTYSGQLDRFLKFRKPDRPGTERTGNQIRSSWLDPVLRSFRILSLAEFSFTVISGRIRFSNPFGSGPKVQPAVSGYMRSHVL